MSASSLSRFGPNQWLVEELYDRFFDDPASVDPALHGFLADSIRGAASAVVRNMESSLEVPTATSVVVGHTATTGAGRRYSALRLLGRRRPRTSPAVDPEAEIVLYAIGVGTPDVGSRAILRRLDVADGQPRGRP